MSEKCSNLRQGHEKSKSSEHLRVEMILRHFYPHMTGVVTHYREMNPELSKLNVSLFVHTNQTSLAPEPSGVLGDIKIRRTKIAHDSEDVKGSENDFRLLREACSYWEKESYLPEVVVVFFSASRKLLPYLLELKRKGVRLILAVTIFPEFDRPPSWFDRLKSAVTTFIFLSLFDSVVVHSTTFVRLYTSMGVARKSLQVIPFPVDCRKFAPCVLDSERQSLRKNLGLPLEDEIVLFMGSVIQRKGADLLMEAWLLLEKHFKGAKLVFVGPYGLRETQLTEALRSEHKRFHLLFENLLDRLENRDSVIITGTVDNPQDYFKAADIFAFPSRLEGMGGVIPEAMACGLPCVLTRFEGFPEKEFGKPDQEYLEAEFTPQSLSTAIGRLLSSPKERQRIGDNARRRVLEGFDLPEMARKFDNVCRGFPA